MRSRMSAANSCRYCARRVLDEAPDDQLDAVDTFERLVAVRGVPVSPETQSASRFPE